MSAHTYRPFRGASTALLAALMLLPGSASAQRGGGAQPTGPQPTQPVGPPRFEYAGPSSDADLAASTALQNDIVTTLTGVTDKMYNSELHYLSRTEMHSDDKWYVEKYKLYLNLVWLLGEVGGGASDVAGGAGYRPTNAQLSVYEDRLRELAAARTDFDQLLKAVEAFNTTHAGKIAPITDKGK